MASRCFAVGSLLTLLLCSAACATESHNRVETTAVSSASRTYEGPKYELALGKVANASTYMRGLFSDGSDQLGSQAKTILMTHLAQSGRFVVVDRENLDALAQETQLRGEQSALTGARVVVTGEVTEFGRKTTGDEQLFGLAGRGKTQTAYAKVSLNVLDVRTSRVVYSVQGAGEYHLSDREILGTGGTSGYDSTLNGKVLDLSMKDAVEKLVLGLERKDWQITEG